ncbi:MAG TPA: YceI family protein [Tepidisphaeraceae bacterium]|jgi:polyisoprenoid-binding protein YceI
MKTRFLSIAAITLLTAAFAPAQTYHVDPIHSSVLFKINHANTANFYGRFNKVAGGITLNENAVTDLMVTVDAQSVDSNNKARDEHLMGPDFFDTKQFPEVTFKSTNIKKIDEKTTEIAGNLTLHGTTKLLTLQLIRTGQGQNVQQKDIVGYETEFTIKRSEFGVSGYIGKGVGDEVTLIVSLEAVRQ